MARKTNTRKPTIHEKGNGSAAPASAESVKSDEIARAIDERRRASLIALAREMFANHYEPPEIIKDKMSNVIARGLLSMPVEMLEWYESLTPEGEEKVSMHPKLLLRKTDELSAAFAREELKHLRVVEQYLAGPYR